MCCQFRKLSRIFFDGSRSEELGFIANIIRHQLMHVALNLEMDTNSLVRELNLLEIHHLSGNTYFYSRVANEKQKDILHSFGLFERSLELMYRKIRHM